MPTQGLQHLVGRRKYRWFDRFMYFVAFAYPASTLPQIIKIFVEKNAESIEISSWLIMIFFALSWMIYGTIHREWPILISNILWISSYIAMVTGVALYG